MVSSSAPVPAPESTAPSRDFLLVLVGQVVSAFGSGLTAFAVAVWVYQQSQSLLQFGLVMFVNALVTAVSAPFLGVACDRYPLRRMMLIGDCGAALLTALLLLVMLSSQLSLWMLLIAVGLDAGFSTLHQIAYRSAVPTMVPKAGLARANGLVETGLGLSALLAPLAAGALIGLIGLAGIFLIDLLSFLVAVLTLSRARFARPDSSAIATKLNAGQGVWSSLRDGWSYLRQQRGLCVLWVIVLVGSFALSGLQVLFAPLVLAQHGAAVLGVLTTIAGIGTLGAGVLMTLRGRQLSSLSLLSCQAVLGALLIALAAVTGSVLWLGALVAATYATSQWGSIVSRTIWQREVDPALRGRVFAFLSASSALVVPLANLGAPLFAECVVQPWLSSRGPGSGPVVQVFGDGLAAAAGLSIAALGAVLLLFALCARWHPTVRGSGATAPMLETP